MFVEKLNFGARCEGHQGLLAVLGHVCIESEDVDFSKDFVLSEPLVQALKEEAA
jgi:hypothetical protein